MKKLLLLLTAIITCTMMQGQNGYELPDETYKEIYQKVTQMDSIAARSFADGIAATTTTQYTFLLLKKHTNRSVFRYYYIPSSLTTQQIELQKKEGCDACLVVDFTVYYDGATADLETTGTERLVFKEVVGSYLDLFPTWQREFLPTANPKNALESFKYREVKNRAIGLDVRLTKHGNNWQLYNWSL